MPRPIPTPAARQADGAQGRTCRSPAIHHTQRSGTCVSATTGTASSTATTTPGRSSRGNLLFRKRPDRGLQMEPGVSRLIEDVSITALAIRPAETQGCKPELRRKAEGRRFGPGPAPPGGVVSWRSMDMVPSNWVAALQIRISLGLFNSGMIVDILGIVAELPVKPHIRFRRIRSLYSDQRCYR
jgi:hypothetical protein